MADLSSNAARRFAPRLARFSGASKGPDEERAELEMLLAAAPGVTSIRAITRHPRGGFVAEMDFSMVHLDAWIEHLDAKGWRGVL